MKKNSHVKRENIEQESWQITARKEESWKYTVWDVSLMRIAFERGEKQRMEKCPREAEWLKKKEEGDI